jgi:Ca2+-binding EF-hand superfamily protein
MEGQGRGQRGGAQMIEMLFNRFDADKNGSISSSEAPDRMKQRFDQLDANGDKSISKQEFETAMSKMRGQRGDKGNAGQGKAGKGKQGQGGKGNNGAAGGKKGRRQFDPANLLKMADKNNDGEISLAEAPERMKRSFDRLDADSSGSVTAEELKAGMAKMRERGGKSKGRNKADDGKNKMPQKPKRPPFDEDLP